MKKPAISIVMPVFNAADFVPDAVKSIIEQTFTDFELIVVDDGCTDNSMEIIHSFDDSRIRVLKNNENSGIVFSRNKGNQAASGSFIAPFDADDIARKDKFEKQIAFLQKNPSYGMVGSWARLIDEHGKLLKEKWKVNARPERIPSILLFRNYFVQSSMLIRREVIPQGDYSIGFDLVEDYKMWVEITRHHLAWNYPDYLIDYRIHPASSTQVRLQQMEEKDAMVFRFAYEALNIMPEPEELRLLTLLKSRKPISGIQVLRDLEQFLLKILGSNTQSGIYNNRELVREIFNRWIKACYKAKELHFRAMHSFLASPLLKTYIKTFLK